MNSLFLYITVIVAVVYASKVCNIPRSDPDDPVSIQVAQLELIKCQIAASKDQALVALENAKLQHSETLAAIKDVSKKIPRATNIYDLLIYIFSSLLVSFIMFQALKCAWYYAKIKSDGIAIWCILVSRCVVRGPLNIGNLPDPSELEAYRDNLSPPLSAYLCLCCCKRKPRAEVIEI